MAWNEPGGSGGKDPWGGGGDQGPPDLDEVMRKMQQRLNRLFGGSGGGGTGSGNGPLYVVLVLLVVAWTLYDATHVIDQSERGVVLRFGEYVDTMDPGMGWRLPRPFETVEKVNVTQVERMPLQAQLLTKDLNLIRIDLVIQFKVKDEQKYLFAVRDPDFSLKEASESALRQVVGGKTMDDILSRGGGRDELVNETWEQIQFTLDKYATGLQVTKVNLNNTQPPEEVQAAFQDAIKAEEDEDTKKKQAQAYANDVVPKAEGLAEQMIQEAEAYKQEVVNNAKGDASRFLQTYEEYKKAPQVTRTRMYIDTVQSMLANSSKVLVKMDQGNSLMYLPIDRFMQGQGGGSQQGGQFRMEDMSKTVKEAVPTTQDDVRSNLRQRSTR